MQIIINVDKCNELGLTPLELLYLHVKYYNLSDELDFNTLMESGYITEDHCITTEGINIILPKVNSDMMFFIKTYDEYPHKVGTRVLKSKSIDSADGKHCLSKYKHYLKVLPDVGEKMYKGLLVYKKLTEKGGNQQYYQEIKTWFNQRTWEKFCDLEIDDNTSEKVERI